MLDQQQVNMSFNLDKFVAQPSQELFLLARKADLLDLSRHYDVTTVKSSMSKQEIRNILIRYFVEQNILGQESLSLIMESQSAIQLKELELKYRLEEKRL